MKLVRGMEVEGGTMGGSKSSSTILLRSAEERDDMSREEVAKSPDEELQTREGEQDARRPSS